MVSCKVGWFLPYPVKLLEMYAHLPFLLILFCCFMNLLATYFPKINTSFHIATFSYSVYKNNSSSDAGDRVALMSLKSIITHDPYNSLSSWGNHSLHFCQWEGVRCSRHKGRLRVTALNLQALDLVGQVPPSLGNLTFLRRLHLPENRLFGPIPDELGMLSNLHHLNLSFNQLEGIIPHTLSQHCSIHLQTISLKNNTLHGEIPANLSHCLGLQYINFQNNFLRGIIPASLGALRGLGSLLLDNNHLEVKGESDWAFLAALANCSNLKVLYLSRNRLGGALPSSIGNLSTSLESLVIDNNQLSGIIPRSIWRLINLQEVYLNNNDLQGTVPLEIGKLEKLSSLSLYVNQISGTLPFSLRNLSNLQYIDLEENYFVGSLSLVFENLTSLSTVRLSENKFVGNIPSFFGSRLHLTRLSISRNNLSGDIPPSIGDIQSLVQLQLSTNKLTGFIPNSLWNLSSLEILELGENKLTGAIPHNIGQALPNLKSLVLNDNQLHGQIPTSLSNCSSLTQVILSLNVFTGIVPTNLGNLKSLRAFEIWNVSLLEARGSSAWTFLEGLANCTNLEVVDLATNYVGGILPSSIANLSKTLSILYLEENNLSGNIPSQIKNLLGLKILDLSSNRLRGTIPTTIASLQALHYLDLSSNELYGDIPSSLGSLTQMNELHLEFNGFTGNIPPSLANCKQLEILNLENNKLIGSIPRGIFAITSLARGLFLSNNSLTGPLPPAVGVLINLVSLFIANNNLSGQIPRNLGQCVQLRYVHMESNFFRGTIPSSLKELRGLEELDLSRNQLFGKIPTFLETFDFLQYLNLSFNHLEGEVPKRGIFANASLYSVLGNKNLCGGIPELNLSSCSINQAMLKHHHSPRATVVATTTAVASVVLLVLVFLIFTAWRNKPRKLLASIQRIAKIQFMKLSYADLLKATDGFSLENLIGTGSFSSVYKGHMDYYEHKIIAVKVLNLDRCGASRSFEVECRALRSIRHRNLLKILTSCSSIDYEGNDFKALVFQFMPNGSLDEWLHPTSNGNSNNIRRRRFTLKQRISIIVDVACALEYLHHHGSMPIIHCDLKPSNVLLDEDMVAHVGDFGLAKLMTETTIDSSQISTESVAVKGTVGYVAPEYGMANQVSTKGDVYSFGIILLEMLTGKRPSDEIFTENYSLYQFVQMAMPERITDVLDPQFLSQKGDMEGGNEHIGKHELECIFSLFKIGLLCSNISPTERIEIGQAFKELCKARDVYIKQEEALPS